MYKRLSLLNFASVVLVIAINYITQALRVNETTIGEISNKYFNLFTPAGYAFAIWGLIFLALIAYSIYQIKLAFSREPLIFIKQTAYWFVLANLLNCVWVFAFAYEYTGVSVLIMIGILYALIQIIRKTKMNLRSVATSTYLFGRLPISLYSGWIAVATIANIAAYLSKLHWKGALFSGEQWTIIMMSIATLINIYMVWKRNMRAFAVVGIWALIAIYKRHTDKVDVLANVAISCSIVLAIIIVAHIISQKKEKSAVPNEELL